MVFWNFEANLRDAVEAEANSGANVI